MNKWIQFLKSKKSKSAFTLLEMLIVLIVVALLMAIIIPNVSGQRDRINQQAAENIKEIVETQRNTYVLVENDDQVSLNELYENGYLTEKQVSEAEKFLLVEGDLGDPVEIRPEFQSQ
ncbi:competence type IV pilus major pilin ComGC [Ignavigranum ruoffiae]|uniref:competence type IV pilus major pilin ComGC n=1 Tax=Ignavigranum ruoffiae TaxID=89093 RepID=UPI002049D477|nr:competence type IV pilus major pilin ComGC [Ignavigranum ruoffiae]UPQ85792.1 competence type IV pilus major pilin ComGC [Ignavigranum ruoffiae]